MGKGNDDRYPRYFRISHRRATGTIETFWTAYSSRRLFNSHYLPVDGCRYKNKWLRYVINEGPFRENRFYEWPTVGGRVKSRSRDGYSVRLEPRRPRPKEFLVLSCGICHKAYVRSFGQICYNCWFSENQQRMLEEEAYRLTQLELFPDSELTENKSTIN